MAGHIKIIKTNVLSLHNMIQELRYLIRTASPDLYADLNDAKLSVPGHMLVIRTYAHGVHSQHACKILVGHAPFPSRPSY